MCEYWDQPKLREKSYDISETLKLCLLWKNYFFKEVPSSMTVQCWLITWKSMDFHVCPTWNQMWWFPSQCIEIHYCVSKKKFLCQYLVNCSSNQNDPSEFVPVNFYVQSVFMETFFNSSGSWQIEFIILKKKNQIASLCLCFILSGPNF